MKNAAAQVSQPAQDLAALVESLAQKNLSADTRIVESKNRVNELRQKANDIEAKIKKIDQELAQHEQKLADDLLAGEQISAAPVSQLKDKKTDLESELRVFRGVIERAKEASKTINAEVKREYEIENYAAVAEVFNELKQALKPVLEKTPLVLKAIALPYMSPWLWTEVKGSLNELGKIEQWEETARKICRDLERGR